MEKKNTIRKVLCILFSFLMAVVLFATAVVSVLRFTVLDRDFFANSLEKSGYVETLHQTLLSELANEGYILGFDEEFFASVITSETARTPVLSSLDKIYGAGDYQSASAEEIAKELTDAFVADLEKREVEVDEEQLTQLENFAKDCAEFYSSSARLPFISVGESLVRNLRPLTGYALVFLVAFALFCALFLVFVNPKKREALRWLSHALGGATLMTAVPPVTMLITGILKKISIADEALYHLVQTVGNDLLYIILAVAAAFVLCSVLLAILYFKRKRR